MNRAYRYRLYPDGEQKVLIIKTFGCVRFVYKRMLAERKMIYEQYRDDREALKRHKYRLPADYKKEYEWMREVDSLALANAQLNLEAAYRNFFRSDKSGFPKFKSRHHDRKSYTTNNQKGSIRIADSNRVRLPKLGEVRLKLHRPIPEDAVIKSATVSLTPAGRYYISILVELDKHVESVLPEKGKVVGLDYSSGGLYMDSEGNRADYPGYYRKSEEKLRKAQRKLSRRKKGGSNSEKQRLRVARLHEKVANQRKDFLHKASRRIANASEAVVVEDLNMKAIARGLHLGKSTHDNGYGMFRRMLEYKLEEQGKQLVVIDKWYPSTKRCHKCGNDYREITLGERNWTCRHCGTVHDRDWNAAINIRNEGCRLLGVA